MKTRKTILAAALGLATLTIPSVNAATYVWTGAGVDVNDIDAADNWTAAGVPADGVKIGTGPSTVGGAGDLISFDSETATAMPTVSIDAVRIASNGTQLPNFELLNGTLNFNRADVWAHPNSTFTIGDGDMTTLAQANFIATVNLARLGSMTYNINADGTLQINAGFLWSSGSNNMVANLFGGSIISTGAVTSGLKADANSFMSFQSAASSFTAAFGGEFADLTEVTSQFGVSFLNDTGSGFLSAVDNGSTFTVSVIPEPSSFALTMVALGGVLLRRRR